MSWLPPPPEDPERPPSVLLPGERAVAIPTADKLLLQGLARCPKTASRAVVLCHPHPQYGGTMNNAIVLTFARMLAEKGPEETASVRFNFRGVEQSQGQYSEGKGELWDVLAAIDWIRRELPLARITVLGYSFGSWVGLRASWEHEEVERAALVAPAMRLFDSEKDRPLPRALPVEVLVGDRDSFLSVGQARQLADWLGAPLHVIDEADHFFVKQRRLVGKTLLSFVAPELLTG